MEKIEHKILAVNGIHMHYAELGQGPLVLFIHGFPELWYSWRHQIVFMAEHGYRAVAPDLRGYGDTTTGSPNDDDITKFTTLHLVGDLVALLQAIAPAEEKVFVVGHDWGAIIAWHLCLFRPEKVKALVNLSVAFLRRDPNTPFVDVFRSSYGDDHYICRFQEPGDIEAEFSDVGLEKLLKKLFTSRDPGPLYFPKAGKGSGTHTPILLPSWLTEEDVKYYLSKFEKTGFTGGLNYYRALNLTWELIAPWDGAKIQVPTKFVVGDLDLAYHMLDLKDNYIHNGGFQEDVPLLKEVVVLKDVGHFVNQETPHETNKHIYDFIQKY